MNQIKALLEKAKSDENLMEKLNELGKKEQDDEIIALASEHGFTITKEEMEEMKNRTTESGKLNEEDLDKVAGGGATQNRWDPNVCPNLTRTRFECVGFMQAVWCDHYKQTDTGRKIVTDRGENIYVKRHQCMMGAFDYEGGKYGEPR